MNKPSATPGICRIDQPSHRTHGFFVRVARKGKIHSAFFTDLKHGGKAGALAAAQQHRQQLLAKLGLPQRMSRRDWAEIRRRKGSSNVVGVQKVISRRGKRPLAYWMATWSPEPYVVRRKSFSIKKFGTREAKRRAVLARRAGVRNMVG
ncbi:MAG TPA: AP2/ERF family transcription factor [Verrucomicrobiae bacterium]|nr:AP2/ERF family transcription factor [Verrucomicrobiae bacterium]